MDALNSKSQRHISEIDGRKMDKTVSAPLDFEVSYRQTAGHLFQVWFLQIVFVALFSGLAALALRRQDTG